MPEQFDTNIVLANRNLYLFWLKFYIRQRLQTFAVHQGISKMLFDKRLLTPCPILTPTDQEFNDPVGYLSSDKVSKLGATYGLVKIVHSSKLETKFPHQP